MPWKSRVTKTLLTIAIALVFVLLLVASQPPAPVVNLYTMGDTVPWGRIDIKVLGMERAKDYQGFENMPDHEFIIVRVLFKNDHSNENWFPEDPDRFYLEEDGEKFSLVTMRIDKNNPYVHRFEKYEEATGIYVYRIPMGQTGLVFFFNQTGKGGGLVQSKVYLDDNTLIN